MNKLWLVGGIAFLCGCASSSSRMTQDKYSSIQTGVSYSVIEADVGEPYAVHTKPGGVVEYEYVERITMGAQVMEEHYFLIVVDGKIVGKYTKQETSPSYNMIYQEDPNYLSR